MGKISNYARVLAAKLQDVFVCDQTDSNVTTTKSVTVEQIGDAICGEQVHADLETDDQTIIDGINEVNGKADDNSEAIGDLSQLTTTDKSSLVGAVNSLIPTAYSTTGLSYTNCSYVAGGYCKIGSLVIVNMRITVTGAIATSADFITGFPKPIDENTNMVQVSNNANNGFTLKKDGSLSNGSTGLSSGNAVLFSVAYLTRDT